MHYDCSECKKLTPQPTAQECKRCQEMTDEFTALVNEFMRRKEEQPCVTNNGTKQ